MKKPISKLILSTLALFFIFYSANAQTGYRIGDQVADFSLKNIDGKQVSMSGYTDVKGFIVIFSCNHCPWVVLYEDRMIELHNTYAPKGFPVIAINSNDSLVVPEDSYSKMKIRAKEKKFPFVYLYDETQEVAKAFGATRTPHVYIVSRKGMTVEYIGTIDNNPKEPQSVTQYYVKDAIEALLKNQAIAEKETKAIGCTIKWRKSEE
jgi:peroxiredoxin